MMKAEIQVERKKLTDLRRAAYNPREELAPGDSEYEALRNSISDFGLVEPIIWNKRTNRIVGGHQRLTVLQNQGETETDVVAVDLEEIKEKQLNIALNKIEGSWADEQLASMLKEMGTDAERAGFTVEEVDRATLDVEGLIDRTAVETAQAFDNFFNLTLKFDVADKADVKGYIKENGKARLVDLIVEKCMEAEQNGD